MIFLGRDAPQYREVQGYETPRFHTYFPKGIKLMAGGVGTGFHHVKPEEYVPKLFHIYGKIRIHCEEVKLTCDSLNDSDAFVLDGGLIIYVWLGLKSTKTEMFRSNQIANELKETRKGASVEQLKHDGSDEFWKILGGKKDIKKAELKTGGLESHTSDIHSLFLLSDHSGKMKFTKVSEGTIEKKNFSSNDVMIVDVGDHVFIWIGKGATQNEKIKCLDYANDYLGIHKRPSWIPIIKVQEGKEGTQFNKFIKK